MAIAEDAATVLDQFIHDGKLLTYIHEYRS